VQAKFVEQASDEIDNFKKSPLFYENQKGIDIFISDIYIFAFVKLTF